MPTTAALDTMEAVEALPTVEDDPRVIQLKESLASLATREEETAAALREARAAHEAAADALHEVEVEVYADPDVTEDDVAEARAAHEAAAAEVSRLEREAERVAEAITRVRSRLGTERKEEAGRRVYDQYAEVCLATAERAAAALRDARAAVEAMNEARRKAAANNVKPTMDYDRAGLGLPIKPLTNRNNKTVEEALDYALGVAEKPLPALRDQVA
jgi:chromosome segregation ATPase